MWSEWVCMIQKWDLNSNEFEARRLELHPCSSLTPIKNEQQTVFTPFLKPARSHPDSVTPIFSKYVVDICQFCWATTSLPNPVTFYDGATGTRRSLGDLRFLITLVKIPELSVEPVLYGRGCRSSVSRSPSHSGILLIEMGQADCLPISGWAPVCSAFSSWRFRNVFSLFFLRKIGNRLLNQSSPTLMKTNVKMITLKGINSRQNNWI